MKITALPTWSMIAADATRYRQRIGDHLRTWAAMLHARSRSRGVPSRWLAAYDSTTRPIRSRLAAASRESTDRDHAEAAADDLWDTAATAWALVRWLQVERLEHDPGVEHVVAELQAAGRWLAEYPVVVSAHESAIARLFAADSEPLS
jgi:hypothetical protein